MSFPEIAAAFSFKILLGCIYGYVFWRYYHGDDTWALHEEGITELDEWLHSSKGFFADLRPGAAESAANPDMGGITLYLQLTEHWLLRKVLGLCNVISRGNYYINTTLFNFILFWGHYLLFRLLTTLQPHKRRLWFILVFFFPPAIFWLSGIRGDGLLFLCVVLTLWYTWQWLYQSKKASLLFALLSLTGVLVFRLEAAALLAPALLAWWVTVRFNSRPGLAFGAVYTACALLFFGSLFISPDHNVPMMAVQRQANFMQLKGNTRLPLDTLQPTVGSFVRLLPQAAGNTIIRPFPWEAKGALQVMAVLENGLLLLFLIGLLVWPDRQTPLWRHHPLGRVFLFYGFTAFLVIGYIVPFPGAIVRYKIIPELFLLILLASGIRFSPRLRLLSAR